MSRRSPRRQRRSVYENNAERYRKVHVDENRRHRRITQDELFHREGGALLPAPLDVAEEWSRHISKDSAPAVSVFCVAAIFRCRYDEARCWIDSLNSNPLRDVRQAIKLIPEGWRLQIYAQPYTRRIHGLFSCTLVNPVKKMRVTRLGKSRALAVVTACAAAVRLSGTKPKRWD